MGFGDKYMKVLGSGLSRLNWLKELELGNNRISSKGSVALLSNLTPTILSLNLKCNKIGLLGVQNIAKFITSRDACRLENLNLEENHLGNQVTAVLLEALLSNRSIKYLNLSKNLLSDEIAEHFKNYLETSPCKELYLHWNNFKYQFGKIVFPVLGAEEEELFVLDLSNNSLGTPGPDNCIAETCEFLKNNKTLIHLDLSYNCFSFAASKEIAEALENNKTIYGFHFLGNQAYVDNRGFIVPENSS